MLKETNNINRSLFTLGKVLRLPSLCKSSSPLAGTLYCASAVILCPPSPCCLQVIAALAENQGGGAHIPYRDSKLTKVPGLHLHILVTHDLISCTQPYGCIVGLRPRLLWP